MNKKVWKHHVKQCIHASNFHCVIFVQNTNNRPIKFNNMVKYNISLGGSSKNTSTVNSDFRVFGGKTRLFQYRFEFLKELRQDFFL